MARSIRPEFSALNVCVLGLLLAGLLIGASLTFAQPPSGNIGEIEIEGNLRVESQAIRGHISSRVGEPLNDTVVNEDVKAISKMGFFEGVDAKITHRGGKLVLIFEVKERPFITNVKVEGLKQFKLTDEKIQEALKLHPGAIEDPDLVDDTEKALKKVYEDKGYLDVAVSFRADPGANNSAVAVFTIKEGPVVQIGKIEFTGNKVLSSRQLRAAMATSPHNVLSYFLDTGILDPKKLQDDRERITALYYQHGYLNAHVSEPVITRSNGKLTITMDVDEGAQFKTGKIKLEGDLKVPEKDLTSKLTLESGEVFKPSTMQHDVITLSDFYSDRGYAFVNVEPRTQVNPDKHVVTVTFVVHPGQQVLVDRIKITGNTKTSDKVIRRELVIQEQEPYSASAIRSSKARLDALGIFDSSNIGTSAGRAPDRINLDVAVREGQTGSFSLAGGFDSSSSLFGNFHVGENNLFGGGQRVSFDAMVGFLFRNYNISYTEPWFLDMPLAAGFDLYSWEQFLPSFTRKSLGFALRSSYPLAELGLKKFGPFSLADVDAALTYRFESVGIVGIQPFTTEQITKFKGYSQTSEMAPSLRRFTVDNPIDPHSGSVESLSLQLAGLGGTNKFIKGMLHTRFFYPVYKSRTWGDFIYGIGFDYGIGTNLAGGTGGQLPLVERFFPGGPFGPDSVPGYPFYSLGPEVQVFNQFGQSLGFEAVGGSQELILYHQLEFPILDSFGLRGFVFMDAGNAYYLNQFGSLYQLQGALGPGIFWKSPFGPLRLALGFPINPRPQDGHVDFIFGTGANL
ncbi:MAG TPA: outer membrane protein assembly factor BamA [Candidatus Binataceae bacterium]|nr:outer membrane protein assembly factor BamA [Candidatus Binataceae bacterium]